MSDTLFAKIIRREIPAEIVHEDAEVLAFATSTRKRRCTCCSFRRKPIATLNDAGDADALLIGKLALAAARWARQQGLAEEKGYRCVINCNNDGGQTVFHLHLHLLAGRQMIWPPG